MVAESDPDDHVTPPRLHSQPADRDSNPFVAFRRYADDQFYSLFHRLSNPRADPPADPQHDAKQSQGWNDGRHGAWSRFESSYERATNPERRQSERRSADDPVHTAPIPHRRELELRSGQERESPSDQGLAGRALAVLGRTTPEQEAARAVAAERDQRDSSWHGAQNDWRQCGDQKHGGSSFGPISWSWSWGPGGMETGHEASATQERESQTHSQTFGPWSFGPFHIGPMTTSATFPKDIEREFQGLVSELERLGREADHAGKATLHSLTQTQPPQTSCQDIPPEDSAYSPLALTDDKRLGQRLNWCQAFEDLMAAEKGQALPSADNASRPDMTQDPVKQQPLWLERMMRRDLVDEASPWHRTLFRLNEQQQQTPPQPRTAMTAEAHSDERGPETELDFYEQQELLRARQEQQQQQQQASRILSTISTVERVMLPDGSVTTKRVLRRRFADGREEEEDSTERTPPRGPHSVELQDRNEAGDGSAEPKSSSGGWFW